jgi:hypothetical protein
MPSILFIGGFTPAILGEGDVYLLGVVNEATIEELAGRVG